MNTIRTLIIFILVFVIVNNLFGNNIEQMLFTSPIIYKPVIDLTLSRNTKPLNKRQPTGVPEFKITMLISNFVPDKEDKAQFDSFVQISFKEIENIKFLVFKKANFVQELHVLHSGEKIQLITKYKRNIDSLLSKISKENQAYYKKTKQTIISLLKQEDFLTDLSLGEYILTFKLSLLAGVNIGDVYISKFPYYHSFCFRKYYINSALRDSNTKDLVFAITFWNKHISLANICDEKLLNGFQACFYPNQGLKWLTNLKNGKQEDVTVWSPNGENEKKMSFNDWAKMIGVMKK